MIKKYRCVVLGNPKEQQFVIEDKLDEKDAKTIVKVIEKRENQSLVEVEIKTGRYHQIRRHLTMAGFPILGDPEYGHGNKNLDGLKLVAYYLAFRCPVKREEKAFTLPSRFINL